MSGAPTVSSSNLSLEALGSGFARALGRDAGGACEQAFVAQAHEDYAADETPEIDGDDLAAILATAWQAADARTAGQPARITTGPLLGAGGRVTPYDLVIIVQDDAPFLVDSVMGQMAEAGVTVRAMFHPVLVKDAARESVIIVVADPLPQERRDELTRALNSTLADVHAAVADHGAMQALMAKSISHLEGAPAGVDAAVIAENIAFLQWMNADHFVFLGARDYDYPRTADGAYEAEAPLSQSGDGLGVLRDPQRTVLRRANEPAVLTKQMNLIDNYEANIGDVTAMLPVSADTVPLFRRRDQ